MQVFECHVVSYDMDLTVVVWLLLG